MLFLERLCLDVVQLKADTQPLLISASADHTGLLPGSLRCPTVPQKEGGQEGPAHLSSFEAAVQFCELHNLCKERTAWLYSSRCQDQPHHKHHWKQRQPLWRFLLGQLKPGHRVPQGPLID